MDCPPRVTLSWLSVWSLGGFYYAYRSGLEQAPKLVEDPALNDASKNASGTKNASYTPSPALWMLFGMAAVTVVPAAVFVADFNAGMKLISRVYPSYQNPDPFLARKTLIYSHFTFASNAILLGPLQLWDSFRKRFPDVHRALGLVYTLSIAASGLASVTYATKQAYGSDGGFAGQISFGAMAIAVLAYVGKGLLHLADDSPKGRLEHRKAMIRGYICFLGDGLLFRILAMYYLPLRQKLYGDGDGTAAWVTSIWLSWAAPLLCYEIWEGAVDAWKNWK
jgi:uncharacterized membrane protein